MYNLPRISAAPLSSPCITHSHRCPEPVLASRCRPWRCLRLAVRHGCRKRGSRPRPRARRSSRSSAAPRPSPPLRRRVPRSRRSARCTTGWGRCSTRSRAVAVTTAAAWAVPASTPPSSRGAAPPRGLIRCWSRAGPALPLPASCSTPPPRGCSRAAACRAMASRCRAAPTCTHAAAPPPSSVWGWSMPRPRPAFTSWQRGSRQPSAGAQLSCTAWKRASPRWAGSAGSRRRPACCSSQRWRCRWSWASPIPCSLTSRRRRATWRWPPAAIWCLGWRTMAAWCSSCATSCCSSSPLLRWRRGGARR